MRALAFALSAGAVAARAAPAFAEARTTRIETRPFYGATVTLEEGVRVFRPLPRHDRIIINPGGKTPLSLEVNETHNHNFDQGGGSVSNAEAGISGDDGTFGTFGRRRDGRGHRSFRRFGNHHRRHGGG